MLGGHFFQAIRAAAVSSTALRRQQALGNVPYGFGRRLPSPIWFAVHTSAISCRASTAVAFEQLMHGREPWPPGVNAGAGSFRGGASSSATGLAAPFWSPTP